MTLPPLRRPEALFVGLCTLDVIQLVDHVPAANEKLTALDQTIAAGGPATNAAVLHARLGGKPTLLTGLGRHPLSAGVRADLETAGVRVVDLAHNGEDAPSLSTILVTRATGERAVASINAAKTHLVPPSGLGDLVREHSAVLLDGHHPDLALAAARAARSAGVTVVLDGGSFKSVTPELIEYVDVAACSADFHPPGCADADDTFTWLSNHGVPWSAVTDGPRTIRWRGPQNSGEIPVPSAEVVDTLGAGDFFHGALTHRIAAEQHLTDEGFSAALAFAAETATRSCESFGTRQWLVNLPEPEPVRRS